MALNHPLAVVDSHDDDTPRTMSDMHPLGRYASAPHAAGVVNIHLPRWAELVDQWRPWLAAESMSAGPEGTVGLRTYQVMRAAQETFSPPETITAAELVDFMTAHTWKPNTRRTYRASLRKFFTWMNGQGLRTDNPGLLIPKTPLPRTEANPCPDAVIRRALDDAGLDNKLTLSIRLGAEVGLRRGEIACVHANDVVQERDGLWWLRVTGKGGHVRVVPIRPDLAAEIRALPGWLWPHRDDHGTHVKPRWVGKCLSKALNENVELGRVVPHQLRHRFATESYKEGNDLPTVQKLLGHAKIETTRTYVHVPDEHLVRAARNAWLE